MSTRINYNRITGSNIQGDATTVTEPLGTIVVTNDGELRLHDGTTAGGNSVGGGGGGGGGGGSGNRWQITSGTYSVSVADSGVVTMATSRGNIEFGALPEPGGPSHFHIMKAAGDNNDLYFGDDFNYVLQRGPGYNTTPGYGVEIGADDKNGGGHRVWRFGTDGNLTVPGKIKSSTISQVGYQFVVQTGVGGATNNNGASGVSLDHSALVDLIQAGWTAQFANYGPVAVTTVFDYDGVKFIGMGLSGFGANFPITFTSPDHAPAMILPLVVASGSSYWQFGPDGSLLFPDAGLIDDNGGVFRIKSTNSLGVQLGSTDDQNYVTVNTNSVAIQTNSDALNGKTQYNWTFGTDGNLTIPGHIKSTAGTGHVVINSNDGATTHTWIFAANGYLLIPAGNADNTAQGQILSDNESSFINLDVQSSSDITGGMRLGTDGPKPVDIVTNTNNSNHKWRFGAEGALTLPHGAGFGLGEIGQLKVNDSTTQSLDFRDANGRGFYTNNDGYALRSNGNNTWQFGTDGSITFPQGGTLRVGTVPAHSTGAVRDKAGTVAFANGYIYYCTADYAPTQYPALAVTSANGVDPGYLVPNSYQLPSVGWIIYYNNQTAVINQVNNGGNPGYYTVFTDTPLFMPADSVFLYGPPSSDIWKRVAWSGDTW